MMAKGEKIAKDTLFEPERPRARAIDWDPSDRGIHQGAQSVNCNSDAVYMAATDQTPNLTDPLLPRGSHPYMVQVQWATVRLAANGPPHAARGAQMRASSGAAADEAHAIGADLPGAEDQQEAS